MQLVSGAVAKSRLQSVERRLTSVRPAYVLVPLAALQIGIAFWFAFNTPHNGWVWYSGGDATSYWTEAWAVGHWLMPAGAIGWALPLAYGWVPLIAGPSLLTGAQVIVLVQGIVLVPLALLLFWLVANRLFGRVYAWACAVLWVIGPLLLLHGFVPSYHWVFDQLFLVPHWFGFTPMADFPSLVGVLATVWLTLRAVDDGSPTDAVLAGLAGGLTLALKPSNGFMVPALVVLVVGARRWREGALWIAGVVPSLVALALWKQRGLGTLPIKSATPAVRTASSTHPILALSTSKYLPLDPRHYVDELNGLREVFWSLRFVEFLAVAGAFGLIRKSPVRGLFVVVWFLSYGVVKASSSGSNFQSATFWRLAEPALPAYLLLAVGVAYCVPAWGRRAAVAAVPSGGWRAIDWRVVAPAAVVLGLVPILVIATLRAHGPYRYARDENLVQEAPLSSAFHIHAVRIPGNKVRITWVKPPSTGGAVTTFLVMTSGDSDGCVPVQRGASRCKLNDMTTLTETGNTTYVDSMEEYVHKWYRVALAASYNEFHGDLMLVSNAAEVSH